MYVCRYVCMDVCMYVYVCTYVCIMYVCTDIHSCIHACFCIEVYTLGKYGLVRDPGLWVLETAAQTNQNCRCALRSE